MNNKRKTRKKSIIKQIKQRFKMARLGGRLKGQPTGFYPRKLARSIAKANMKRYGVRHVNKNFSRYWTQFVFLKKRSAKKEAGADGR